MSTDFYLVCQDRKIYMPLLSMKLRGTHLVSGNWVEEFILTCQGSEIKLVSENSDDMDLPHTSEGVWTFMNAWHPHPDDEANDSKVREGE